MINIGCDKTLPDGWRWCSANDVMDIRDGTHDSPKYQVSGIPLVTSKNLINGSIDFSTCQFISEIDHKSISKRSFVSDGDILYAMIGTIGNPVIVQKEIDFSIKNVALFKFDKKIIDNKFFYHYLNSDLTVRQFKKDSRGGTQKFVSLGNIRKLQVPLPPLNEQKRIAAILDKADAIRRKRQQAIDLADQFLRSVFLDMFGDPVTNPKRWDIKSVGEITDCIVPGRDKPKSFTGKTAWVTTNDLIHLGVTKYAESFLGLTDNEIEEVNAKVVPSGSVIMTCVGDLGVVTVSSVPMVINQQLHAFQCQEVINNFYLMYALSFQKTYMLKMASSTTVPYMNKTVCNSIPIPVPPLELQNKFSTIVTSKLKNNSVIDNFFQSTLLLIGSLSQQAFNGKLTQTKAA